MPTGGCCGLASMPTLFATPAAREADGLHRQVGERLDDGVRQPVAPSSSSALRLRERWRRRRAAVGDRQHHRDQRDAVGDAVVDARDQRAVLAVEFFDQMELPQRPRRIERRRGELADALLAAPRAAPGRAGAAASPHDVRVEVEAPSAARPTPRPSRPRPPSAGSAGTPAAVRERARHSASTRQPRLRAARRRRSSSGWRRCPCAAMRCRRATCARWRQRCSWASLVSSPTACRRGSDDAG